MRRKVGLILVFGAALPLAVASAAWACGVLATLTLDKKVAAPGDALTVTGRNYSDTTGGVSSVKVRLKSRDGRVLTEVAAADRKIEDTFTLPPDISPGWYVVLATQTTATGAQKAGTPGRTTLRVQSASDRSEVVPAAPWASSADGGSGSQSPLAILLAAGLSLTMLFGGWKLLSRKSRSVSEPHVAV